MGKLEILVLVDDESRLPRIPGAVEDMSAVTRVVGEITAHAINLGVSGGNSLMCSGVTARAAQLVSRSVITQPQELTESFSSI